MTSYLSMPLLLKMKKATEHIQGTEQHGFTVGQSILEASCPMIDAITHAKIEDRSLMILSIDFSTAFDRPRA